jgi:hypothetical protein
MTDLFARAAKIFKTGPDGIVWPYGLSVPDRRRTGLSKAKWQWMADHARAAQLSIVEWAEHHEVKASPIGCCPLWLARPSSRRCKFGTCRNYGGLDYLWLDHPMGWLKDGRPAVLTSAPYRLYDEDRGHINEWLQKDDRLRADFGGGWYGYSTTQIVMWRTDRITGVAPAPDPHGEVSLAARTTSLEGGI